MKKITYLILLFFISINIYSQQGFENTTGPDPIPSKLWSLSSGTTLNGNWAVFDNNVGTNVRWDNCVVGTAYQGANAAYCNRENIGAGNTSEDFLATPAITVPANGQLKFWTRHYLTAPTNTIYEVRIKLQTASAQDNPNDYVVIPGGAWTDATLNTTPTVYEEKTVNIPTPFIGVPVYIAFVMKFTQPGGIEASDRWLIDNVRILQQCIAPSSLSAAPTQTTAVLSWNTNGASSFQIENGLNGFTPTGLPTGTSLTGSFTQTGLIANSNYCYYVRADCENATYSNWSGPFCYATTIENDECANATTLSINSNTTCSLVTNGNVINATQSLPINTCAGTANDDVWFKFTATSSTHLISLINFTSGTTDLVHSVYSGTCGALTLLYCSDPNSSVASNLTVGQTYYIRIYTWTATSNQTSTFQVCIGTPTPVITTNTTTYTTTQLVTNVLLNAGCSSIFNISSSSGNNFGSVNGIGYFNKNGSSFPFNEGIILSSGNALLSSGPENSTQSAGIGTWTGDADLESIILLATGNAMNSKNASKLEFDFIPQISNFNFDFILASEEYGEFQCDYSDAFAFLLTDTFTGVTKNLAVIPQTTTPISVVTIRNSLYNSSCISENEVFFGNYYDTGGQDPLSSPTNFVGSTIPMNASSTLIPGRTYHIKLVVADRFDTLLDTAVFIRGGSFNIGLAPTFTTVSLPTAICAGSSYTLPLISSNNINGSWSPSFNNTTTTTYTFTPAPNQCATGLIRTIAVTPNVDPTFSVVDPVCSGTSIAALPTSSNNIPAITGTWSPAINNTVTTTYTFTPSAGQCANSVTKQIVIIPTITPTFTQIAPICIGDSLATLPTTSLNGISGTWSPAINNTATTTYTFTPIPTPGVCANTATMTIVVNQLIVPTFINPAPICSGAVAPVLPTSSTNTPPITGTWSGPISNTATGTYTFTPTAGQCATTATITLTVDTTCSFDSYASAIWLDNCSTAGFFNTVGSGTSLIGPATNVFPNVNLGTYVQNSNTFILRGAELKTFKTISSNVCGANFYYRVYQTATGPGTLTFSTINLSFLSDCSGGSFNVGGGPCTSGDQKWQKVLNNAQSPINLTAYPAGNYTIETYLDIVGSSTSTSGCLDSKLINNNGANFKANYSILSLPTYTSTNPSTCNGTEGTITISGLTAFTTYAVTYTDDGVVVGPTNILSNASGQIILTGLNAGSYTNISSIINGCTAVGGPITLTNPIIVPTFNQINPICIGGVINLPTSSTNTVPVIGTWSPAVDNTVTTTYTFTPNAVPNQCTTLPNTTMTIVVNQPVVPTFTQVAAICTGATLAALPTTSNNGVTGTWSPAMNNTITTTYTFTPINGLCATTQTMTIDVIPNNTITLSSAAATIAQSVCINSPIANITYTTTGAIGATVSSLPAGVSSSWSALTGILISGTPTVAGTFNYVVTLTGGCGVITTNGQIIVKPNNTLVLSSTAATTNQTRCRNSAITNIRYTSSGATNVTVTGLPTGMSGNWAANVLTISGASNIPGIYPYTITTSGGCGAQISLSGTITISPNNTITLNTANNTTSQTVCVGTPIATINYLTTGATGATISGLPTGVTGSWSALTGYTIIGTPTVTVASPYTYTISLTGGCNVPVVTATGTITVTPLTPTTFAIPTSSVCNGGSVPLLPLTSTNSTPINGTWSPNLVSNTASGSYLFTPAAGQCAAPYTFNFVVNPLPAAPTVSIITQPTCLAGGRIDITSPLNTTGVASNLFISEVTDEETGSLTYVEIYNGTGVTKNLANYKLKIYNNGITTPSCDLTLSGTLLNNAVNIIKISSDPNVGGVIPNQIYASCGGVNDNDNIKLTTNSDVVIDNWGRTDGVPYTPNNQPGYTYRRLATATVPNTGWNPADWTAINPQNYTNVGSYNYLSNLYSYNVDGGSYQSAVTFSPLAPGSHTFTVKNLATGCISSGTTVSLNAITGSITPVFAAYSSATACQSPSLQVLLNTTSDNGVSGTWSPNIVDYSILGNTTYSFTPTTGQCATNISFTITITPNNTIALTSAVNTDNQTVCIGSPLVNITYGTTGASSATITGLPAGVSGNWLANVVTISGSPNTNVSSPFTYTITLNGGCGTVVKTGTITVTPNNTIALTSAVNTDNQTVCIGSPLVNITYGTTGATSATITGLPTGVSGNWSANVVTITGSPNTIVGSPFTYTITLNGGCGTVVKTGTIIVISVNTIALTSAVNTDNQTVCIGSPLVNITYGTAGATSATITGLPAGVSGNWAANVVTITGSPNTIVGSPFTYTITLNGGCGTVVKTGTITVTPNNTIALTSAVNTDNQTVCIGSPLVNITYGTTGATNATITGLPAGVSGNWLANVVTITGSPNTNVGSPFTYTITLNGGCGTVVKTGTITITPNNTIALLSANTIQTVCSGTAITNISYSSTGATGATFALPAGLTGLFVVATGAITISGIPTASGNYTVSLNGGCGNITASGTITVTAKITPTFNPIAPICFGGLVPTLPTVSTNMISGTWSPAVISNTVSGTYNFIPTSGCADNNGKITVIVTPDFDFNITGGCLGNNFMLNTVSTSTFSSYSWKDASNFVISTDASFNVTNYISSNNITPNFPIVYSLTVANAAGCSKTKYFSVDGLRCGIQNGISPNGVNNFFDLKNRNVAKLEIFNRYGLLEYSRDNYTEEWFGQNYAGIDLPDGTYFYLIAFKDNQEPVTGWIYINREHK
jgi:hypothetical protein